MALMAALLTRHYRNRHVHLAVLDTPGMSLLPFAACPSVNIFLFHRHEGIWTVAWVKRDDNSVWMFDGISNSPGNISNDNERTSRLGALLAKPNHWAARGPPGPRRSQAVDLVRGACRVQARGSDPGWLATPRLGRGHLPRVADDLVPPL
jgi:hypothetical protein